MIEPGLNATILKVQLSDPLTPESARESEGSRAFSGDRDVRESIDPPVPLTTANSGEDLFLDTDVPTVTDTEEAPRLSLKFADVARQALPALDFNGPATLTISAATTTTTLGLDIADFKASPWSRVGDDLTALYSDFQDFASARRAEGESLRPAEFDPGGLMPVYDGYVVIDAWAADGDSTGLLAELEGLGLIEGASFADVASGLLPLDAIDNLTGVSALAAASPSIAITNAGLTTSQGDPAMRADEARSQFGVDGSGVRVGVLSDSMNFLGGLSGDIDSGDLPSDIRILDDFDDTDEGRAMAQLIHDVAPGASISFHTATPGIANFAQGILDLQADGASVIVDDVIDFKEPMFEDGEIAQAVDTVVSEGANYFSAAGNEGRSAYEAPFRDGGTFFIGSIEYQLHDFDSGADVDVQQAVTLDPGASLDLSFQWADPIGNVDTDMDIFVLDGAGNVVAQSIDNNILNDTPIELLKFQNTTESTTTFDIVIGKFDGPDPTDLKYVNFGDSSEQAIEDAEFNTPSGSVFGHAAASGAISVGAAAFFDTPAFGTDPPQAEGFTSAGPVRILFDANGNRLASPEVRNGVDITAPDGTNTTFFGSDKPEDPDSFPNFSGTSAAAPHAAAVAALMREFDSSLTPSDVLAALRSTAIDMDDPDLSGFQTGEDLATGFGLIQADAALSEVNDIPTAAPDTGTSDEDTPLSVTTAAGLLANDDDPESSVLTVSAVEGAAANVGQQIALASEALLTVNADGSYAYDPNGQFESLAAGESDSDSFSYTVSDGTGGEDTGTVTITVDGVNDAPAAAADGNATNEDMGLSVAAGAGLLSNDTDADASDVLSVSAVEGVAADVGQQIVLASGALLTVDADGSYTYDPNGAFEALAAGESDSDSFTYTVADGNGGTDAATATITVDGVNDSPVAAADGNATNEDMGLSVAAGAGLLSNDTDVDASDVLSVSAVEGAAADVGQQITLASGALLTVDADGSYTYDPNGQFESLAAGESDSDSFTYTVADGNGGTDAATATITVDGVNDSPVAAADGNATNEDMGLSVAVAAGLVANDTDADASDVLSVSAVEGAAADVGQQITLASGALLTVDADGSYTYDPNGAFEALAAGESDSDSFTYTVADGNGGTDAATATITIDGVNDAPAAAADAGATDEDSALSVAAGAGLLSNDTDADASDTLSVSAVEGAAADVGQQIVLASGALLTVDADGSYAYDPNGAFEALAAGESDSDSFTYTVADGNGGTDAATATITVDGVNDSPVAAADGNATNEDMGLSVAVAAGLVANDTDVDASDVLNVSAVEGAAGNVGQQIVLASGALLTVNADGSYVYDPAEAFDFLSTGETATDSFTYTVSDGEGGTDTATVTLTIDGANEQVIGTSADDSLDGSEFADDIDGQEGDDVLRGFGGDDTLDGGPGVDRLEGGPGNDTYLVDDAGDTIVEQPGQGNADTVRSSVTLTLANRVEDLVLLGTADLDGTGNGFPNTIDGNSGANDLRGGGNDDLLRGAGGADRLFGSIGDDTLEGGAGGDFLSGIFGSDTLAGGVGDDSYRVQDPAVQIVEAAGEGRDDARASGDFTLPDNVENLRLIGTDPLDGTGNDLANTIVGNGAANVLTGGAGDDRINAGRGDDTLIGGPGIDRLAGNQGDDTYIVDEAGDRIVEQPGQGTDTVRTSIDLTLPNRVEDAIITVDTGLSVTGNGFPNAMTGGAGADTLRGGGNDDTLIGGAGNDRLFASIGDDTVDGGPGDDFVSGLFGNDLLEGGAGDDSYRVHDPAVQVVEAAGEGFDDVRASRDFTLPENVENLRLIGGGDLAGTGNDLANTIVGNASANALDGAGGGDRLIGGLGDDSLIGGPGGDTFVFAAGFGADTVGDFTAGGTEDVLDFSALGIMRSDLAVSQDGADTLVTVAATGDSVRLVGVDPAAIDETGDFVF